MSKKPTEIMSDAVYTKKKHMLLSIKEEVELLKHLDKFALVTP
jgi:hypothetical protein